MIRTGEYTAEPDIRRYDEDTYSEAGRLSMRPMPSSRIRSSSAPWRAPGRSGRTPAIMGASAHLLAAVRTGQAGVAGYAGP
jgi:hypothetical protein